MQIQDRMDIKSWAKILLLLPSNNKLDQSQ